MNKRKKKKNKTAVSWRMHQQLDKDLTFISTDLLSLDKHLKEVLVVIPHCVVNWTELFTSLPSHFINSSKLLHMSALVFHSVNITLTKTVYLVTQFFLIIHPEWHHSCLFITVEVARAILGEDLNWSVRQGNKLLHVAYVNHKRVAIFQNAKDKYR